MIRWMILVSLSILASCSKPAENVSDSSPKTLSPNIKTRRMVAVVKTPNGNATSSMIYKVQEFCGFGLEGKICGINDHSEAMPINLPNGKTIYILTSKNKQTQYLMLHVKDAAQKVQGDKEYFNIGHYPDIVYFDNEMDPRSVHIIDTKKPFFDNYIISLLYTEPSHGRASDIIRKKLPWLGGVDGNIGGYVFSASDTINKSSFIYSDAGILSGQNFYRNNLKMETTDDN